MGGGRAAPRLGCPGGAARLHARARQDLLLALVRLPVRGLRGGARPGRRRGPPAGHRAGRRPAGASLRRVPPAHASGGGSDARMSGRARLLLFAGGSALFAYLISRIGIPALIADAAATGWMFIPILLLYGLVYACNAAAWRLIVADEPRRPSFWRLYVVTVSGFALNFVTPMVNVGGEPFKIAAAARWLGVRRAAGSVVIYQVLHTLGMLLSFLTAIVLGLLLLPPHPALRAGLVVAFLVLALLCWLLLTGHRRGVLESALDLIHRLPL